MSETPLHRDLVMSLVSHLATSEAVVTHVAGSNNYPDPPKIGRHEPDVYFVTGNGQVVIGEAKTGADLTEPTSCEQLADFSRHVGANGERATFWLSVPEGWRERALRAIQDAGGELHDRVDVLTVSGLRLT